MNGPRRKAPTILSPVAEVHETPTDMLVRVRRQQGALELSVPKSALRETPPLSKNVVRLIASRHPIRHVRYELDEVGEPTQAAVLEPVLALKRELFTAG